MTSLKIETSYKQAIISHIAEKDIKEINLLITSNINFQKDIDKWRLDILEIKTNLSNKIGSSMSIDQTGLDTHREATSAYVNKHTNGIKEFENYIEENILSIKKIISTRDERIKIYL